MSWRKSAVTLVIALLLASGYVESKSLNLTIDDDVQKNFTGNNKRTEIEAKKKIIIASRIERSLNYGRAVGKPKDDDEPSILCPEFRSGSDPIDSLDSPKKTAEGATETGKEENEPNAGMTHGNEENQDSSNEPKESFPFDDENDRPADKPVEKLPFDSEKGHPAGNPEEAHYFHPENGHPVGKPEETHSFHPKNDRPADNPEGDHTFDANNGRPFGNPEEAHPYQPENGQPAGNPEETYSFHPENDRPAGSSEETHSSHPENGEPARIPEEVHPFHSEEDQPVDKADVILPIHPKNDQPVGLPDEFFTFNSEYDRPPGTSNEFLSFDPDNHSPSGKPHESLSYHWENNMSSKEDQGEDDDDEDDDYDDEFPSQVGVGNGASETERGPEGESRPEAENGREGENRPAVDYKPEMANRPSSGLLKAEEEKLSTCMGFGDSNIVIRILINGGEDCEEERPKINAEGSIKSIDANALKIFNDFKIVNSSNEPELPIPLVGGGTEKNDEVDDDKRRKNIYTSWPDQEKIGNEYGGGRVDSFAEDYYWNKEYVNGEKVNDYKEHYNLDDYDYASAFVSEKE